MLGIGLSSCLEVDVAELPSGTVTLLFADVEGSTRLVQQLGDGYGAVLDEHRRLLRRAVAEAGGVEVDCRADELFAAFVGRTMRSRPRPQAIRRSRPTRGRRGRGARAHGPAYG